MAKEEAREEPSAYIDYTGDSSAITSAEYTTRNVQDYWRKQLVRKHRMAALPLTIKDRSLWKRLVQQYEAEDLIAMIDLWFESDQKNPADFVVFYSIRGGLHKSLQPKDYTWD